MKKIIAIYPGTFDPVTNGHLDIIERASELFTEVIVSIAVNRNKKPMFENEERLDMLKNVTRHLGNVKVDSFEGLLVRYAERMKANVMIRGLRAVSDFEYEFQMSLTNKKLNPGINTIFMMPNEKYTYLNSSLVRELASYNANVDEFIPPYVLKKLKEKFGY
ncbi:MAG TPA: pantetheine-phosphate adenylyltransferase [Ignavibacteria bacterium]|nr:pantetheine-phosphate adenylyltransferase [Bacteroidota bacterium]HRI84271.1 pantetheine-phosphate adenylyltransferase [Ignavibacteria bacterium]HRK00327.1 pantetheine-phosphate adenylyltransferase [Ignavibacteria bacterium]